MLLPLCRYHWFDQKKVAFNALVTLTTLFCAPLTSTSTLFAQTTVQFGVDPERTQTNQEPADNFKFRQIPSIESTSKLPFEARVTAPGEAQKSQTKPKAEITGWEVPKTRAPFVPSDKPGDNSFRILRQENRRTAGPLARQSAPQRGNNTVERRPLINSSSNFSKVAYRQDTPPLPSVATGQQDAEPVGVLRPNDAGGIQGLQNEVKIFLDPDTGRTYLTGDDADIAIVTKAFDDLEAQDPPPTAERILLNNISNDEIVESVQEIYDGNYAQSQGRAFIRPLRSPNGIFVFGTERAIDSVRKIVEKLDGDPPPTSDVDGPFATFRLKHISAVDAKLRLDGYFGQAGDGGGENRIPSDPVTTVADFRSNVLIVRGGKQYLEQAARLIRAIDVDDGGSTDVVRIFKLKNTLAEEIAPVLQDAISGQQANAGQGFNPNQNQQQNVQPGQADANTSTLKSGNLRLKTYGADGQEVAGGIMFGVRITADANSNSLVVRGPESGMPVIEELINQLDRLPDAETLIKVFAVENGDAQSLLDTLQALFTGDQNQQGQAGNQNGSSNSLPLQSASATQGASLINLRFSIDERTNSIIATGPVGDLRVVEDLIYRLDESKTEERQTVVHRLSNSPVLDVQQSLQEWLDARTDRDGDDPRTSPGVALAERDVDVVAEVVSNSLIISATPRFMPQIMEVIRRLDRRPPMVKVKVLIAEVNLNTLEEFGVELGVQDSLLFDRGTVIGPAGAITGGIGFPFNSTVNAGLNANSVSVSPQTLAGQALTNFGTGRVGAGGQSGLVLSAGNESINVLIRSLKTRNCLRVLSKPHIVTLENLQGRVAIGQRIPRITGSNQNAIGGGVQNQVEDVDVGVILEMTPRVTPDGMIVLFVNAVNSNLDTAAPGIPVAVDANGNPVLQQPINSTSAQTTIMARSGQTVVFSGLIQESKVHTEAGVPVLSDLPLIGPLFKSESDSVDRSELMIILTPYLVDGDEEIEIQNQDEIDRMHWCLCDVAEVYGKTDYNGYQVENGAVDTIYPDQSFEPIRNIEPRQPVAPYQGDPGYQYRAPQSNNSTGRDGDNKRFVNPLKRLVRRASGSEEDNRQRGTVRQAGFESQQNNRGQR